MLEIGIGDSSSPAPLLSEPSLSFDDDGYYWFLHPLFAELAQETRQYVDLYGHARFAGGDLLALERMLHRAVALVESQPESWAESVGMQFHGEESREIFHEVSKERFQELIRQWQALLVRAMAINLGIVCFGD